MTPIDTFDMALDRAQRLIEAGRGNERRPAHWEFAHLYFLSDDEIIKYAQSWGPLEAGWLERAPNHRAIPIGDPPIVSSAPRIAYWEPIICWRCESASIASITALAELAAVPSGVRPSHGSPDRTLTLGQFVDDRINRFEHAANFLYMHRSAPHHDSIARSRGMFAVTEYQSSPSQPPRRRAKTMIALFPNYRTGRAQELMRLRFVIDINEIFIHLHRHLRADLDWNPQSIAPHLAVLGLSALGDMYTSVIVQTLRNIKRRRVCDVCKLPIPDRDRWRKDANYCSVTCKSDAQKKRRRLKRRNASEAQAQLP